jgi:hypothetical protein
MPSRDRNDMAQDCRELGPRDFFSPSFREHVEQPDSSIPCIVYRLIGKRGKKAMELMKSGGFLAVYNISGGINRWKEADLPIKSLRVPFPILTGMVDTLWTMASFCNVRSFRLDCVTSWNRDLLPECPG